MGFKPMLLNFGVMRLMVSSLLFSAWNSITLAFFLIRLENQDYCNPSCLSVKSKGKVLCFLLLTMLSSYWGNNTDIWRIYLKAGADDSTSGELAKFS